MISYFNRLRHSLAHLSIYSQIVIGNAIIIIFGAIGGTLITRHLTDIAADVWLIVVFATIGTALTIVINGWVIRKALKPLRDLSQVFNQHQFEKTGYELDQFRDKDPDIFSLASGLDTLFHQLEKQNLELRALSQRAIQAQEEERKRIARSLHDDTGQALSTLIINLERLERKLLPEETDLIRSMISVQDLASNTLHELRKIIYGLRPTLLDDLGLVPAIRWYARSTLEEAGIRVEVNASDEHLVLSPELKTSLFRIAQEAINNIVKHSGASSSVISIFRNETTITLCVEDDGHGFDVNLASTQAIKLQQWGILGIRERAELVGAELKLNSAAGQGTSLEVVLPLRPINRVLNGKDTRFTG